jgi:hypothetical protein
LKRKFEQLKKDEVATRVTIQKKMGTYKTGVNMADADGALPKKGPIICPLCGKKGHKTNKSKRCLFYQSAVVPPAPTTSNHEQLTDADAAEDLANYYHDMHLADDDDDDGNNNTAGVI